MRESAPTGATGICHTRWATHGAPNHINAHPIFSGDEIAVVHNGIIENFEELRTRLKAAGYVFASQTDTEVIAHLVHSHYSGDLFVAVQRAAAELRGAYAIAVFCKSEPQRVVGARQGSPLVLGVGANASAGETFLASDAMALAGTTDQIIYLEEGDVADIGLGRYTIVDRAGRPAARALRRQRLRRAVELGPAFHAEESSSSRSHRRRSKAWRHRTDIFGTGAKDVRRGRRGAHPYANQLLCGLTASSGSKPSPPADPGGGRERIPLPRQRAQPGAWWW